MTDTLRRPAMPAVESRQALAGLLDSALEALPRGLLIDGEWRAGAEGLELVVSDPATGRDLARTADASREDGAAALDAAVGAQHEWARTPPRERAEILRRAWELAVERREELAALMSAEMGKPMAQARGEVDYGAEFLRWYSEEAVRINGRLQRSPEGSLQIEVRKRPVGPCLFITPWNFPLAMATRKVAPALAAGCTVVLKPSESTPLTALAFGRLMQDAGLPAGVLNLVPTSDSRRLTAPLIEDRRLRKLSFTGSTAVGSALLAQASANVLKCSMELGGSAPFIVFEDADLDTALDAAMQAKMRNMGEACTAANRFFVHERLAEAFAAELASRFASLTLGPGLDPATDVGPLISQQQRESVQHLVQAAVADGGIVLTGGRARDGVGYFYEPTVMTGLSHESTIMTEEIFGPVAAIATFTDEAEALTMANAAEVGLAGYIFTTDPARIQRMADTLEVGMIGVNTGLVSNAAAPFGGIKQSGLGREGGAEGIEEYLEAIYIATPHAWGSGVDRVG